MRKTTFALAGIFVSMFATSCIKSDAPVIFEGYQIETIDSTPLSYTVARKDDDTGRVQDAYQLKKEENNLYLYMCPYDTDVGGHAYQLEKAQAFVYAIPGHEGYYVMSLEEGDFILDDRDPGHEFYVIKLFRNKAEILPIKLHRDEMSGTYFSDYQPLSSGDDDPGTYPVEAIKTFLVEHIDTYWEQNVTEGRNYAYYDVNLNSCDF